MNEGLIPRRYAKALYEVAVGSKKAERLYALMTTLEQAFAAAPALGTTLANPFVSVADKQALLTTAAGAGPDDKVFDDFLKLLAQNRRLDMAADICRAYNSLYRAERHIYKVHVTSAAELPADQEKRIRDLVSSHLGKGSMEYTTSVDPDLVGGFTINIDNELLDASVRQQLQQLRRQLIQ